VKMENLEFSCGKYGDKFSQCDRYWTGKMLVQWSLVFSVVAPCSHEEVGLRFKGTYCFHHQGGEFSLPSSGPSFRNDWATCLSVCGGESPLHWTAFCFDIYRVCI
jgi:hypothetical protein